MSLRFIHDSTNARVIFFSDIKLTNNSFALVSSEIINKPLGGVFRGAISKWIEDHPHSALGNFWSAVSK